jgi:hypothetical protein
MASMFDRAMTSLVTHMKASIGRQVQYTFSQITTSNGSQTYTALGTVTLTMWVGNTKFALDPKSPGGARVQFGDRDYLVAVADFLAAVGANATPVKGDRIQDVDNNGNTIVYELSTPTGEPVWRYSDQTRQVLRLHTKRAK